VLQTLNPEIDNYWEKLRKTNLRFSKLHVSLLSFTILLFVVGDKGEKTFANASVALSSSGLQQNY
jgi:hypothetical protein